MLNEYIVFSRTAALDILIKSLISTALMCLLCPVEVAEYLEMPISLQTLIILWCAVMFGWRVGVISTTAYVLLGLAGLPVFAGYHGGIGHLNGMFGGFFFGFIISALITGFLAEMPVFRKVLPCLAMWVIGHVIVLALGAVWLVRFNPDNWWDMIEVTLPGGVVKSVFGLLFTQLALRLAMRRQEYYTR